MAELIIFGIVSIISFIWLCGIDHAEAEERNHKSENESKEEFWGEYP